MVIEVFFSTLAANLMIVNYFTPQENKINMKKILLFLFVTNIVVTNVFAQCEAVNTGFSFVAPANSAAGSGMQWCTTESALVASKEDTNVFGTFSSTPIDIFANAGVGLIYITPTGPFPGVEPGSYEITFTSGACSTTKTLVVSSPSSADASFGYEIVEGDGTIRDFSFCQDDPNIFPSITGDTGGVFSVQPETGLAIDLVTGEIDFSSSVPAANNIAYRVTYSIEKTCGTTVTVDSKFHDIKILEYKEADFSYGVSNFCQGDDNPTPNVPSGLLGNYTAQSFPSDNGNVLVFADQTFGTIDLTATPVGVYDITLTSTEPNCTEASHTERIEILNGIETGFRLASDNRLAFCDVSGQKEIVPFNFTSGGVFSATPAGLSIDSSTGVIDMEVSDPGIYDITYDFSGPVCGSVYTLNGVQIKIPEPVTNSLQEFCASANPRVNDLVATTANGFDLRWYDSETSVTVLNPPGTDADPNPLYEFLETGIYYVATYSSACGSETERVPVTVRVYDSSYALLTQASVDGAELSPVATSITVTEGQSLSLALGDNFSGSVAWSGPNAFTATGAEAFISADLVTTDAGIYTATVNFSNCSVSASVNFDLTVVSATVLLSPQVYLQGAMLGSTDGLMRDDLRQLGYLPTTSPYGDGEQVQIPSIFGAMIPESSSIVDWIWVELRDATDNTVVVSGKSGLLRRDGMVINVRNNPLEFTTPPGDYYVVIKHRNHLGIMSKDPVSLSGTAVIADFTTAAGIATFGTEAQTNFGMPAGTLGMWAGDANGDGEVLMFGANNDPLAIRDTILNDVSNSVNLLIYNPTGYLTSDLYLDGEVKFSGSLNDVLVVRNNILANPENIANILIFKLRSKLP